MSRMAFYAVVEKYRGDVPMIGHARRVDPEIFSCIEVRISIRKTTVP